VSERDRDLDAPIVDVSTSMICRWVYEAAGELREWTHGARGILDHTMIRVEDTDATIGWPASKLEYVPLRRTGFYSFSL
jgi:hypothetical protein